MEAFHRQIDLLDPSDLEHLDVDLIGAGALGGTILMCLGKMGFGVRTRLTVTDFDHCEAHNLPTQWFKATDVALGRPKVDALGEMAEWVLDHEVEAVNGRFDGTEDRPVGPIVILAVDTLEERRRIWANLRNRDDVRLLVDARAGAEVVEVHVLDPARDSIEDYEASLEGEPFDEPCTRRSISYTMMGAASFVGAVIRAWVSGVSYPRSMAFDFRNFWLHVEDAGADGHRGVA